MEQVYNHTQDKASYHDRGIRSKAEDIQSKATALKSTAAGQSTTELTNTRDYDIQGDENKGKELAGKANELKDAADTLNQAAESLRAEAAKNQSPLNPLKDPAQSLRDAAKKTSGGNDHLYYAAEQLATHSGTSGLDNLATKVIQRFEAVQQAYKQLSSQPAYTAHKTNPLVIAVENAYNDVENIYERILNLTKLIKEADALSTAAKTASDTLKNAADTLVSNVKDLRDGSGTDAHTNAKTVIQEFEKVRENFNALTKPEQSVQTAFSALNTAYDHILNLSKTTKLKTAAGKSATSGLRQKAQELYNKAKALADKVNEADTDPEAAKVLKAKAGGPTDEDKLRKLAEDLHTTASQLATAVKGGNADEGKASALATAVGERDEPPPAGEPKTLRQALHQLASSDPSQLTNPAGKVKAQYEKVKDAYEKVVEQKATHSKYTDGDQPQKYQAVVDAWDAFNAVYNPEEQLKNAVVPLQVALTALAEADILNLHSKAEDVKQKFEGFGTGVKSKLELVKAQEYAYEAAPGNFKTDKYNPLVTDFDNFYKAYRNAVFSPKFYSIVVPSIISQW